MSEGYASENALVTEESNNYDRMMDTILGLSVIGFLLGLLTLVNAVSLDASGMGLGTLFLSLLAIAVGATVAVGVSSSMNVTPITSQRTRGVTLGILVSLIGLSVVGFSGLALATVLGLILTVQGVAVGAAGAVSRMGLVESEPASSAGLIAGSAFGVVGFLVGIALGVTYLGGTLAWIVAIAAGVGFLGLTVGPREDISSTLPSAVVLIVLGLVVTLSVIGPGWEWRPQAIQGGFTGGVVIPIFTLLGSLVAAWAAAKCRAGFGARGRQYGAFVLINLNALLMVAVMAAIVVFVAIRGLDYALHSFRIGALSAVVLLSPLLVLAVDWARTPAGSEQWHSGARQLFRVVPLAILGALVAWLLSILVTGTAFSIPYAYDVLQNRELVPVDTAFRVTPEPTVGTLLLLFPALSLFGVFLRRYGSLSQVGSRLDRQQDLQRGIGLAVGLIALLALVFAALGTTPFGLPLAGTVGLGLVFLAALGAVAASLAVVRAVLVGEGTAAERAHRRAQVVKIGLFGGLGLLTAATFLELTAVVNPSVGPPNLVPVVALLGAATGLVTAVVTARARRSMTVETPDERLRHRVVGEETTLGLVAAAGYVAVVALHVAATGASFTLFGITVSNAGTLSWPMVMQPYIPLGPDPGGILPAVAGTIWLVVGAASFAVPLGVGAAVFLTEYAEQGRFTDTVEVATNALWSTPSVVFGLFGAAFLIPRLGDDESIMSGMLVLGFMLLPLVLITSRESIKSVPDEYRDASAALGVNQWETIRSVVLPAAIPGVVTGVILGVGRIAGETAPLILVLGSTLNETASIDVLGSFQFMSQPPFVYNGALLEASAALPTQVWAVIAAGVSGSPSMGWASAFVLLVVVLSFYTIGIVTRTYFRRKLEHE
jgi:phosphate transport system permease protein